MNTDGLNTLEQEIGADNCLTRRLDVTDKKDFDAAIAAFAEETGGKMDMLFSNAGIGESGWFEDIPYEAAMRVVKVNFIGVINSVYAALPLLKATPNSLVFITSSSSATYGMPRIAVYSATKHRREGTDRSVVGRILALRRARGRYAARPDRHQHPARHAQPFQRAAARRRRSFHAAAPKKGMFRLMPASSVAECAWAAYHSDKLHWYVPPEIAGSTASRRSRRASCARRSRSACWTCFAGSERGIPEMVGGAASRRRCDRQTPPYPHLEDATPRHPVAHCRKADVHALICVKSACARARRFAIKDVIADLHGVVPSARPSPAAHRRRETRSRRPWYRTAAARPS